MKKLFLIILSIGVLFIFGCSIEIDKNGYYKEELGNYKELCDNEIENKIVKNLILIIGDGMGENHVELSKMICFDFALDVTKMEYKNYMSTNCLDNYVTDSAASATAIATGVKTNYKCVGVDKDGNELDTFLDFAKIKGLSTGVITTKHLFDATPAAFTSHANNRSMTDAIIEDQVNSNIDILMGGSYSNYMDYEGQIIKNGYEVIRETKEIKDLRKALMDSKSNKIFGLFSNNSIIKNGENIPSLADMTKKSIEVLSKNPNGFILVVEEGQIDTYACDNDVSKTVEKVVELDKALRVSLNYARSNQETLVIVLGDHESGGLKIGEGEPNNSWFTSDYHTNVDVLVYSFGLHSSKFNKKIDNTDISKMIVELMNL